MAGLRHKARHKRIFRPEVVGDHFNLYFLTPAGLAATVQYRDSLAANGNWLTLTNVPSSTSLKTNSITTSLTLSTPQRFYRVSLE